MTIKQLDPHASVYSLVHNDTNNQKMLNNVGMMNLISREIENTVIRDHVPSRIFSSFQRISSFLPQRNRYEKLAVHAEAVYIFAYFDTVPPPIVNVHFVPIPHNAQFAKEWFVVAESANFFTALVTEEIDSPDDPRAQRMFRGFWSFDEEMVMIIQQWLSNLVGISPLDYGDNRTHVNYQTHISVMGNVISRLTHELAVAKGA